MTALIIYCIVCYLVGLGVKVDKEFNDNYPLSFLFFIIWLFAPIAVPMYLGYKLSKIK